MALLSVPFTFTVGAVIVAAQHNSNFSTIYSDYSGNIDDTNIAANAAIEYSKLSLNASITYGDLANATKTSIQNNLGIPSGIISMWSGSIATIPSGWVLCDGSNSTPDLRDMFIVGAKQDDSGVAKSNITGSLLQSSATGVYPAHQHDISAGDGSSTSSGGTFTNLNAVDGGNSTAGHSLTITNAVNSSGAGTKVISVFYALAFVMKS